MNLLEEAEEQERLLDKSAKALEKRKRKEIQLRSQLEQKEAEKQDIEERYASLQEEAAGKTERLKEVWKQLQQTKEEVWFCSVWVIKKIEEFVVYRIAGNFRGRKLTNL